MAKLQVSSSVSLITCRPSYNCVRRRAGSANVKSRKERRKAQKHWGELQSIRMDKHKLILVLFLILLLRCFALKFVLSLSNLGFS